MLNEELVVSPADLRRSVEQSRDDGSSSPPGFQIRRVGRPREGLGRRTSPAEEAGER